MGKFAASLVGIARFSSSLPNETLVDSEDAKDLTATALEKAVQVQINNASRVIIGKKRNDRIRVQDLLARAGLPMYNAVVVKATVLESWKAMTSCDGPAGTRNPLGISMSSTTLRPTRSEAGGIIPNHHKVSSNIFANRRILNERANAFSYYAMRNGLVLNAAKTQLMVGGDIKASDLASLRVVVDGVETTPAKEMELLGVHFDTKFSTLPHEVRMASAARQRAGLIARLAHHLPRGKYLSQLARGLVVGKLGYAIAATVPPRLEGEETAPSKSSRAIQVALNDVARTITGKRRSDKIRTSDLLRLACLPSYNELTVKAVALETWKAFHSSDGNGNQRNPVGKITFPTGLHAPKYGNIVKFQNSPCVGTSNKGGTCYTRDECSTKGGTVAGSCASGYGVCCTCTLEDCTRDNGTTLLGANPLLLQLAELVELILGRFLCGCILIDIPSGILTADPQILNPLGPVIQVEIQSGIPSMKPTGDPRILNPLGSVLWLEIQNGTPLMGPINDPQISNHHPPLLLLERAELLKPIWRGFLGGCALVEIPL
eukprot:maker-scaffold1425_size42047-snap-gene-0.4 protein:Tk12322 transcript:maker-scaffold1425_size42047-snap-gene-0.4-mRNA-1 annotation:"hypothetical protein DAPPUDRAFT_311633"